MSRVRRRPKGNDMARTDSRTAVAPAVLRHAQVVAGELATRAAQAYSAMPLHGLPFERKKDRSRVTRLDLDLEKDWRDIIRRHFPKHSIVGEEYGADALDPDFCWYLDPVDGTDDLTRGIPLYGFIAALHYRALPLVGLIGHPALGLRATAVFGEGARVNDRRVARFADRQSQDAAVALPAMEDFMRDGDLSGLYVRLSRHFPNSRTYRNVYAHTAVLTGALDAAIEFDVAEWDLAATRLFVEEAGGAFREFRRYAGSTGESRLGAVFGAQEPVDIAYALIDQGP